jgi:serine/threonine protein kinase
MNGAPGAQGPRDATRTWCVTCRALYRSAYARCPSDGGELVSAVDDPLVGQTLADRFVIERVLGEGGLGRVYAARHTRMSRRYAIKVPYGELTHDPIARTRFLREADVVGRLEHPSVVAATDVGETPQGLLYLAMDLAEGFGLDVVLEAGAMPGHRIPVLIEQLLSGLAHAHERHVVHRDLKPANVIIDRDRARIVDFGIAALAEEVGHAQTRLTTEGTIIGTPEYMAPEQLSGQSVDARTDLFSLGVMLYEMLSGKLPFDGGPMEIAAANMSDDPPRITVRAPDVGVVDPLIEALARWMMEKQPSARPQKAADALAVLRLVKQDRAAAARQLARWLEPERVSLAMGHDSAQTTRMLARSTPASTVPPPPAPHGEPRRSGRRAGMIAIASAVVLAVVSVGVWQATTTEPRQLQAQAQAAQLQASPPPLEPPPRVAPQPPPPPPLDVGPVTTPDPAQSARPPAPATRPPPRVTRQAPAVTLPQPPVATTPAPAAPTSSSFSSRYTTVGESLATLRRTHGDAAIADLLGRYRAIAYLDAVRKPDLRAAAMRELDAIARAVATAASSPP